MSSKSLEQILGYVPLLEAIETVKKGIPNPLPPAFSTSTRSVLGNTARWIVTTGTRQTATLSQYGAAARKRAQRSVGSQDVVLMHSFEEISFNPIVLQQLRNYSNYEVQSMGEEEVARQVGNFTELFANLRIAANMMMLVNGKLWFDGSGNLLPTSSGAIETISVNRSANNENQLNSLITTPWSNTGANIPNDLRKLKLRAAQDTGYEPVYALYGSNVPGYIEQNDYVIDYLSRSPNWNSRVNESPDIPEGLFGYKWVPMYTSFFDSTGAAADDTTPTYQTIWDPDTIVFCPEPNKQWWEVIEGSYPIPTSINVQTDAEAALRSLKEVFGMFGYSLVALNPVSINTYMGDTFFPAIKNPAVTYAMKVSF